ncbi:hypothetical protein D3C80_533740 [compost metagenome]
MTANITQEFEIIDVTQPVGIVDHHSVGRAITKGQVICKNAFDTSDVLGNGIFGHQLARFILEGWVADHACAATHKGYSPVSGLLQPMQHHDLDQATSVQAWCCWIKANISCHGFLDQQFIEAAFIRHLMNEAALGKRAKKIGFETGHVLFLTDKA